MLERRFRLRERGTTLGREVRAGAVTFLTMAYILAVNPQILGDAGMPTDDVAIATALAAALGTLVMGLWADLPIALAPGMGLNAYFTWGVVHGLGVPWTVALAAVFVEGLLFLVLSVAGARTALVEAIPASLKAAIMGGIGLFLALIGLRNAGLVVDHPATLLALGELDDPSAGLALGGLVVMTVLLVRGAAGAILLTIAGLSAVAWSFGWAAAPTAWIAWPQLPEETFLALDFDRILEPAILGVVAAFFFVDLLDTAGTLVGVGKLGGFVDSTGRLERGDRAFTADAVGTVGGALLGTSTVTSYIESATGIEEGGRTGLTAVVVAALFLASLFFVPVVVAIPAAATAPALLVVGALMMQGLREIDWKQLEEGLPAFFTVVLMPFTYSIANGIAAGVLLWVAVRILAGRFREVRPGLAVLALLLVAFLALGGA